MARRKPAQPQQEDVMAQKKQVTEPVTGRVVLVLDGQAQNSDAQKTG